MKKYTESILGTLLLAALITTIVLPRKNPEQASKAVKDAFDVTTAAVYSIFGIKKGSS